MREAEIALVVVLCVSTTYLLLCLLWALWQRRKGAQKAMHDVEKPKKSVSFQKREPMSEEPYLFAKWRSFRTGKQPNPKTAECGTEMSESDAEEEGTMEATSFNEEKMQLFEPPILVSRWQSFKKSLSFSSRKAPSVLLHSNAQSLRWEEPKKKDLDHWARVVTRVIKKNYYSKMFKRALEGHKKAELARQHLLAVGKAGAVGVGLNPNMTVHTLMAGGASEKAGMKVGDLLIFAETKGYGGKMVTNPIHTREKFLEVVGPQNEMFEGESTAITAIRDPAQQQKWRGLDLPNPKKADDATWKAAAASFATLLFNVTLQAETEAVRKTRLKKLAQVRDAQRIANMDIELVNNFMSYPEACREYTLRVFNNIAEGSCGSLDEAGVRRVCVEMAGHTGTAHPAKGDVNKLFHRMEQTREKTVSFDQFYPQFRSFQIKAIAKLLEADQLN